MPAATSLLGLLLLLLLLLTTASSGSWISKIWNKIAASKCKNGRSGCCYEAELIKLHKGLLWVIYTF